jgi:hypothetical protein
MLEGVALHDAIVAEELAEKILDPVDAGRVIHDKAANSASRSKEE